MEGGKPSGSSFTSDLFGAKDSSPASQSCGIWGSIFPPPAKASGGEPLPVTETDKKNDTATQASSAVSGGQEQNWSRKEKSSYFQEEKVEPFHYSSSIYYGGQDVYYQPPTAHNPGLTTFSKDVGGEDDSNSASRGNWWQGSLYY